MLSTKRSRPEQVIIGGEIGGQIWDKYIIPILRKDKSCRELAKELGVSHETVFRWRRDYLKK